MKKSINIALLLLLSLQVMAQLSPQEKKDGWKLLFNGKNLDGWNQKNGQAKYEVRNGEIVGITVAKTPNSFLCTNEEYGDFILELELKVDEAMNSGIQFRSLSVPTFENGRVHGYQMEIDPSSRGCSSGIYDETRKGWLCENEGR